MTYPAHDAFVAPARARPDLWRLALGLLLAVVVYVLCFLVLLGILWLVAGPDGAQLWLNRLGRAETPTGALLLLCTFLGMALGPMVAVRLVHRRAMATLFGPRARVLRHFLLAAIACGTVYGLSMLIPAGFTPDPNLDMAMWLSFLPLALVGVLVQTGAEEVLFRGYLQQQLAARFDSPLIWMVLPAAAFAIAHYDPANAGDNTWLVVAATGLFALCAADLTAKTGSIGAAWGFHFTNNCVAILFMALDGPLSGLALYITPFNGTDIEILRPLLLRDMATTLVAWAAIRAVLSRA